MHLVIPPGTTCVYLMEDEFTFWPAHLNMQEVRRVLASQSPEAFRSDGQGRALRFFNAELMPQGEIPVTASAYKQLIQQLKARPARRRKPCSGVHAPRFCRGLVAVRTFAWSGPDRFWVRGRGVEGVYSANARWSGDPEPGLYLVPLGGFDRMATAKNAAVPTTGGGWRRLLREVRGAPGCRHVQHGGRDKS